MVSRLLPRRALAPALRSLSACAPCAPALRAPTTPTRRGLAAAAAAAGQRDVLFKLTGSDQLGVVAAFSRVLADHGAQVLDVDQSACTVHSTFTLDLLARCGEQGAVMQAMLTAAQARQLTLEVVALEPGTIRSDDSPGTRYKLTLFAHGMRFEVLALVAEAAAEAGLTVERIDRLTPLTIPIGPRPETALRLILGEGAGATAEGAEEGAAVEAFMQSLRFVQTELDCHVLLEEHHVPGRPGFSEEVIDGVVRHSLLLRLAVRHPAASDPLLLLDPSPNPRGGPLSRPKRRLIAS